MKIVHGIYDGLAFTRRSVYNVRMYLADKSKWEAKRMKHKYLPVVPTLHEVAMPEKFKKLLARKQREAPVKFPPYMKGKIYQKMNHYLSKNFVRDEVEFTYIVDDDIHAISITHALDSFSRKAGREYAMERIGAGWAYRKGMKTELDHKFIAYETEESVA